jgi:hypothetical protein
MRSVTWLLLALAASPAWAAFKCVDEKGLAHFGDSPPPACARVTIYEVGPSGAVIRKIEPQAAIAPGSAERAEADRKRDAETRRRDRTLLDTYSSEREFDLARDRNVDMIKGRIEAADIRLRQLEQS